jgi:aldehyde dehydrogenase (NAD+)
MYGILHGRNLIDGHWRGGDASLQTCNPSNLDETVGVYAAASVADAEEAMAAARRAQPGWAKENIQVKADILNKAGTLLLARATEIGTLLAREEGKVLKEAVGEVTRAAHCFQFYGAEALRHPGQWYNSLRDGHNVIVSYEPVGVVTAITPWNFPIAIAAWKTAAALAFGNTVVLKPSECAPGCAVKLGEILLAAGLPAGCFNLLIGEGAKLGPTLIHGADALSFTGSTPTGKALLKTAAESMTKTQLELGGKNPFIVADDADLDVAVSAAALGTWGQTGQRCTGSERIIVTRGIHDEFVERLLKAVATFTPGDALDPAAVIGPVATKPQWEKNLAAVAAARQDGAELAHGGVAMEGRHNGMFMTPALFLNTSNTMALNRHETFGPIGAVIKVADLDEAIAVANDCELALSSGIATTSLKTAERYRRESKAGTVMVNTPTAGLEYHVPFGGRPPSGFGGRETGTAAAAFFTESKTAYIHHGVD